MRAWFLGCAVLVGCSEYGIGTKPEVGSVLDTGSPVQPPQTTPPPLDPTETDTTTPPPGCEVFVEPDVRWVGSAPFTALADPVDANGVVFWDPAADVSAWAEVAIPDRGVPIGTDRAYVGRFTLDALPPNLSVGLESDDGIWLWVNGTEIGHWGGEWQEEGCVNENANCLLTTTVPPVDVTPFLVVGENVFGARISNPVFDAWFEILLSCED